MQIDTLSRRLIDRYQHGMPLCAEPYRAMAEELGCSEGEVLACPSACRRRAGCRVSARCSSTAAPGPARW